MQGEFRYNSNKKIRKQIDKLLHQNSIVQSSLGTDSTKKEKEEAKEKVIELKKKIYALDENFAESVFLEVE